MKLKSIILFTLLIGIALIEHSCFGCPDNYYDIIGVESSSYFNTENAQSNIGMTSYWDSLGIFLNLDYEEITENNSGLTSSCLMACDPNTYIKWKLDSLRVYDYLEDSNSDITKSIRILFNEDHFKPDTFLSIPTAQIDTMFKYHKYDYSFCLASPYLFDTWHRYKFVFVGNDGSYLTALTDSIYITN